MQVPGAGTWQQGSTDGSIMGYLPWLMSCGFLQINPGVRREHLISQLVWVAALLLVTCGSSVYLVVDEFDSCVL